MESLNSEKFQEVELGLSYEAIKKIEDLVLDWKLDDTEFQLEGLHIIVYLVPPVNDDGEPNGAPGEFSAIEDYLYAVYIWENLSENIKRVVLFHELTEILAFIGDDEKRSQFSHSTALKLESHIINKLTLTDQELQTLNMFRGQF